MLKFKGVRSFTFFHIRKYVYKIRSTNLKLLCKLALIYSSLHVVIIVFLKSSISIGFLPLYLPASLVIDILFFCFYKSEILSNSAIAPTSVSINFHCMVLVSMFFFMDTRVTPLETNNSEIFNKSIVLLANSEKSIHKTYRPHGKRVQKTLYEELCNIYLYWGLILVWCNFNRSTVQFNQLKEYNAPLG